MTDSSDKLKFEEAIQQYIKTLATDQDIVTGWVIGAVVKHPEMPNGDGYIVENSDGMPYHSQIGLITAMLDEKRNTILSQVINES
jgi:hypothetical protein